MENKEIITYKNYEKMVNKLAYSWNKTTQIDIETLKAEANVIFVECLNIYNPDKGRFSTLLYLKICNRFKNLIIKRNAPKRNRIDFEFLEAIYPSDNYNPEKRCIFKNLISNMSKEAKELITIVLDAPADLVEMLPLPRLNVHQLTKYMVKSKGWKSATMLKAVNEIKNTIR